jgi:hypothetical protein
MLAFFRAAHIAYPRVLVAALNRVAPIALVRAPTVAARLDIDLASVEIRVVECLDAVARLLFRSHMDKRVPVEFVSLDDDLDDVSQASRPISLLVVPGFS